MFGNTGTGHDPPGIPSHVKSKSDFREPSYAILCPGLGVKIVREQDRDGEAVGQSLEKSHDDALHFITFFLLV
jgi:hypothetical protein